MEVSIDSNIIEKYRIDENGRDEEMEIKVLLDENLKAKMPTKAHESDAGFDIYSTETFYLHGRESKVVDSGVHMLIPSGYVGMVKSKSGLNVKSNITCEGVVDAGYTGNIIIKLYNHGYESVKIEEGQKLTQIVILPIPTVKLAEVTSFEEETERGDNGFGSSGKF